MKKSLIKFFGNVKSKTFHKLQNEIQIEWSNQNKELAEILYREGLLLTYSVLNNKIIALVNLRNEYAVNSFQPITKKYNNKMIKYSTLSRISPNKNNLVLITNNGMKSLQQCHRIHKGGKPICKI